MNHFDSAEIHVVVIVIRGAALFLNWIKKINKNWNEIQQNTNKISEDII